MRDPTSSLGEFEQLVLLSILRNPEQPFAINVRRSLEVEAHRHVTRGALYRTLDRLEEKALIEWDVDGAGLPERGGHPMRRLHVTGDGVRALRSSRRVLVRMWSGLESLLGEP